MPYLQNGVDQLEDFKLFNNCHLASISNIHVHAVVKKRILTTN